MADKDIKKTFKKEASKNYKKYYAVSVLEAEGFQRKQCNCGTFFWTINEDQKNCGDPACSGGFQFFGKSPARKEMDYIQVWKQFAKLFKDRGYTPIPRYPVVARWRDDADFVQASIYDFQPYVVSGEVEPPANPLVVPQFSLRFNDIDNVGITGAHYTGFVMIGQHAFDTKERWDQNKYFTDIHNWLKIGLGLPNKEITYHEDAWAGGGNFGPCMEFFSRGLELGNQVYMMYEQTPKGNKELNLKVLDMGMGHERNAWFTKGASTSYETTFPTVSKKMFELTGIKVDNDLVQRFLPYSSYLNMDEVEDINKVWKDIAKRLSVDQKQLQDTILPLSSLFSVAEHARSLLVALSDGALPSNVGGGYNLRVILRRALSMLDRYQWKVNMNDLCDWHASYLRPLFPELSENLENVKKILDVEKQKYKATKQKTAQIVSRLADKKITSDKLLELYDSQGISPEIIKQEAEKNNKKVTIPDNFYAMVAERHEQEEQKHATVKEEKINLEGLPETEALYYGDYLKLSNKAKVIEVIDNDVIVDKTVAYPTSGGQLHDRAFLDDQEVADIFKQGNIIVHRLKERPKCKVGDVIEVQIDEEYRKQLAQHHTATHIINAAAKEILGNHINQASAKKAGDKAHLDITHYGNISQEETKKIENRANDIVKKHITVKKFFLPRTEAEKRYGMRLYQGGAVPGKSVRIVDIEGIDVEACGGTHLNNTSEVGTIRVIKTNKVQDGVVRITFTAGKASDKGAQVVDTILKEAAKLLEVAIGEVPARAEELFKKWKSAKKALKKNKVIELAELELKKIEKYEGDILVKTAEILNTQKEHILNTLKRFKDELEQMKEKLK
ncbi:alanine--tRNA ligase [Candidatus Woesearchaeota archaeon]|nr:alanine--tRNA ligase [Candidatus Woesearchaeota archaeon]